MKKISRLSATTWLTTKTVFSQIFAVLLFAIQAPVLGPRAFGLISVVMVFVGFCELVLCEAVAEALISVRKIETVHFDTMNTVIALVSALCGVIVFIGAGAAAQLYGDANLAPILRCLSVLPLISALGVSPTASTKRDMLFQPLALRSMTSLFVGGIIGLVFTLTGYGVWALVWQALATRLIATVVLWMAVPLRFHLGFQRAACNELLRFALPTLLSRTMGWGSNQFPRLVFGFYWGVTELGLFGLAARLCDIVLEIALVPRYAVARVELRQFAGDSAGLQHAARGLLVNMSAVAFPLCVGGAAVVPTLFHVWLGERWFGGIVPSQLMMLTGVPYVTLYACGAMLLAMNRQAAEALLSVVQTVTTVIVVLMFAPLGLVPATWAFALRLPALLPLPALLVRNHCAVPLRALFAAQGPAFVAAALMGLIVTGVRLGLEGHLPAVIMLGVLVFVGAAVYGAMLWLLIPDFVRGFMAKLGLKSLRGGG